MKTIGVILSGCGVKDGSEIHEATLTLAAIDRLGHQYICLAPHKQQTQVINHFDNRPSPQEQRNVIFEAARIARGAIKELSLVSMDSLDAVILPGGMGAVSNLCDFAGNGVTGGIDEQVERLLKEALAQKKPIGAMCIAPVVVARAFRDAPNVKVKLTIGNDPTVAAAINQMGMIHQERAVDEICVDIMFRVVSTPCYMLAKRISEVETGVNRLVEEVIALI